MKTQQRKTAGTRRTMNQVPSKARRKSSGNAHRRPERPASYSGKTKKSQETAPEVVYTPAKPFSRNRFLLKLATVAAVVIAVIFGLSIFFKVDADKMRVSGNDKYSPYAIREASGIQNGDNLLTLGRARASGKIIKALPYVKNARIGIKLPDVVHIEIEEFEVVYALQDGSNNWWLMTSGGKIVEKAAASDARDYTNILGFKLDNPQQGSNAVALEAVSDEPETVPQDSTAPTAAKPNTATAAQQLEAALEILQCLEKNGVIGDAKNIDVTDLEKLQLWYGEQYQVKLGDASRLDYKIRCMKSVIDHMKDYQSGILDVSFTIWPDMPGYTPF